MGQIFRLVVPEELLHNLNESARILLQKLESSGIATRINLLILAVKILHLLKQLCLYLGRICVCHTSTSLVS